MYSLSSAFTKACDRCRDRKTKCVPSEEASQKCKVCYHLDINCRRTHRPRRSGPRTSREKNLALGRPGQSGLASSKIVAPAIDPSSAPYDEKSSLRTWTREFEHNHSGSKSPSERPDLDRPSRNRSERRMTTDASDSFLNQFEIEETYSLPARGQVSVPPTAPDGEDTQTRASATTSNRLSYNMQDTWEMDATTRGRSDLDSPGLTANTAGIQDLDSRTSQTLSMPHDIPVAVSSANPILHKQASWPTTGQDFPQIETLMDWQTVNFFLPLYIKHQHHLMPLVHKPTFAQDVLTRRDRQDEVFRALILSLVAYVICQLPKVEMSERFTQAELEKFAATSYTASRSISSSHLSRPSLPLLVSVIANHYYCKTSLGLEISRVTLAQATGLAQTLATDDVLLGDHSDEITRELSRRAFWHLFNMDKTEAVCGENMLLANIDQLPPFPLEIDDEYLTSQGHFPQPESSPSYMTGFVTNTKLFKSLAECLFRHRNVAFMLRAGVGREVLGDWVKQQRGVLPRTLQQLSPAWTTRHTRPNSKDDLFATQYANIVVTAVTLELALIDLMAVLDPSFAQEPERQKLSESAFELLSSCQYRHLGQSGESMRSKIFHILLSVASGSPGGSSAKGGFQDWWNIYSQIQWVQMACLNSTITFQPSGDLMSELDDRAPAIQ